MSGPSRVPPPASPPPRLAPDPRLSAPREGRRVWTRTRVRDRLLDLFIALLGAVLVLAVATVPLLPREQAIFAVAAALCFLIVNRLRGRMVTMFLVMLSLSVSLRYIFWRITETLTFNSPSELFLGVLLALAEVYAIMVLVLGYIQCVWPLERKPVPLPGRPRAVADRRPVYIPTYNEPMSVVRATVLGRDGDRLWPPEQAAHLHPGRRAGGKSSASSPRSCGIGYITRTNNDHAKAGNLNNALAHDQWRAWSAVFDSDHIPTRAFLQMTVGWMMRRAERSRWCRRRTISTRPIRSSGISPQARRVPCRRQHVLRPGAGRQRLLECLLLLRLLRGDPARRAGRASAASRWRR